MTPKDEIVKQILHLKLKKQTPQVKLEIQRLQQKLEEGNNGN